MTPSKGSDFRESLIFLNRNKSSGEQLGMLQRARLSHSDPVDHQHLISKGELLSPIKKHLPAP